MSTVKLKLGPTDHGLPLSLDDFESAEYVSGFKYEIIDGRLYVSAEPDPTENELELWLFDKLRDYSRACPGVLNHVTNKPRVFIRSRPHDTVPEPDVAAYANYPLEKRFTGTKWPQVSPLLVCEVMTGDSTKDLERNVALYLDVPTIQEYWVLDARVEPEQPTLIQHRRQRKKWLVQEYSYGTMFSTKLLPGFSLLIDPRR